MRIENDYNPHKIVEIVICNVIWVLIINGISVFLRHHVNSLYLQNFLYLIIRFVRIRFQRKDFFQRGKTEFLLP